MFTLVAGVVQDKIYWEKKMFSLVFLSTNCADVIHQLFTVIGGPEMVVEYSVGWCGGTQIYCRENDITNKN